MPLSVPQEDHEYFGRSENFPSDVIIVTHTMLTTADLGGRTRTPFQ